MISNTQEALDEPTQVVDGGRRGLTQSEFRQQLHGLTMTAAQTLPLVQIFEVLTSQLHAFRLAYEMAMVEEIRERGSVSSAPESPP